MSFDLGIRAGYLLTMKDGQGNVDRDYFVGVKGGAITEVAPFKESHVSASAEFLDKRDQIVMPGLINAHTHLAMSLFRGFQDDRPFQEWLFESVLPIEAKIVDEEFVKTGVELSLLECMRFGTTTVNEMYYFSDVIAQSIDRAGMRAIVGWPFIDFVVPDEKHLGATALATRGNRYRDFHKRYENHPRIRPAIAPHAPYTCGDDLLRQVLALSNELNASIHMHVSEPKTEVSDSLEKYGKTPPQRLYDLGLLNPRFMAAHGVQLTDEDIELFRKTGAGIIHNPDSNLKLSSGIAPIVKYRQAGIKVALGSDGAASNNDLSMFGPMDLATKLQKLSNHSNTAMVALDALNLATLEGAKVLGLDHLIGSIEVGKRADIITLRTDLPHVQPLHSVLSQLVYAYQGMEVDTTICDGRILYQNGNYNTLDPRLIYPEVEKMRVRVNECLVKS